MVHGSGTLSISLNGGSCSSECTHLMWGDTTTAITTGGVLYLLNNYWSILNSN